MFLLKNYSLKIVFLVLAFFLLFPNYCLAQAEVKYLPITSSSAILIDAHSGRILWEKNSRERRPIASTTKIMTAVLVLERLKLDDKVEISQRASDAGESELYLSPGEERTVEELLYGLILRSANDAANALAEKTGGSVEAFATLMNQKARQLGAKDTNFTNPHGLKDGNHYSTAYDIALITRYALKNPLFARIVQTREHIIDWPNNPFPRVCQNHNKLLSIYPYATGVKTGYTREAGYCLVGSASKDGLKLISVILNASNSQTLYNESALLLDYGFNNYSRIKLIEKGKSYGVYSDFESEEKTPLIASKSLYATVEKDSKKLHKEINIIKHSPLPIRKGQVLGDITYKNGDSVMGIIELVAAKDIKKPTIISKISRSISNIFSYLQRFFS